MSWHWQYSWWNTFKDYLSSELFLLAAFNEQRELVGVAPLYRGRAKLRDVIAVERTQFIGNWWRSQGPPTMRTEHLDFVVRNDVAEEAGCALIEALLRDDSWDEIALALVKSDSRVLQCLKNVVPPEQGIYVRHAVSHASYHIDTTGTFAEYLAGRGKNTRLQMFNRRRQLEKTTGLRLDLCHDGDGAAFLDILDYLHRLRWGYETFDSRRLAFNRTLAALLLSEGKGNFLVMWSGERPLSALYNYRCGDQEHYLQGGFDEQFDRKLQLGFLHLGYAIEQAFADPRIRRFNMLSGAGKNTSYKERLTTTYDHLVDVQLIRSRTLRFAFSIYDAVLRRNEPLPVREASA